MFVIKPENAIASALVTGVVFSALLELRNIAKKGALVAPFLFLLYKRTI
jgi:hypothetical protein